MSDAPEEPRKLLERSFVWFVLGIIVAVAVGTVSLLAWLEGFVDRRIANPAVERPPGQGITEARAREIVGEIESDLQPFRDAQGAVIAFDRDSGCPPGWALFEPALSRTIVGAVAGRSSDVPTRGEDGTPLSARQYRADGGTEAHTLTLAQIPGHAHSVPFVPEVSNLSGNSYAVMSDARHPSPSRSQVSTTSTGGTQNGNAAPHNNMPPYIALYLCKKTD